MLMPCFLALLAAKIFAQSPATNFTASKDLVLSTKTPLGDATVTIPSGTAITNYEAQGGQVKIWQGPFTAVVATNDVQAEPVPTAKPDPSPAPSPEANPGIAAPTAPQPAAAGPDVSAMEFPSMDNAGLLPVISPALPDWLLPGAGGALVAYALFATIALLRTSRRRGETRHASSAHTGNEAPVIALPPETKAKPAVVTHGGRAIACPLCGKEIAMEKVSKGRNRCPSCQGTYVVE
jgi:hypothetical protein